MSRVALTRCVLVVGGVAAVEGGLRPGKACCRTGIINRLTMIPPSAMIVAALHLLTIRSIQADLLFTVTNAAAAIAIAVSAGFAAGIAIKALPRLRRVIDPLLAAYYAVPTFIFYPMLVAILGLNRAPLIAIGAVLGIVAMIVNTLDGLDRIPPVYLKTAAALRMPRLQTALLVQLPAATPYLVTGVKLAVSYSIVGTIAGEFILSVAGLGRAMSLAYNTLDNATMYGLLLILIATVTAINLAIYEWERGVHRRWGLR
jgi:NitT/TauT family transport system permease protein